MVLSLSLDVTSHVPFSIKLKNPSNPKRNNRLASTSVWYNITIKGSTPTKTPATHPKSFRYLLSMRIHQTFESIIQYPKAKTSPTVVVRAMILPITAIAANASKYNNFSTILPSSAKVLLIINANMISTAENLDPATSRLAPIPYSLLTFLSLRKLCPCSTTESTAILKLGILSIIKANTH